jgi:hypothetical protein
MRGCYRETVRAAVTAGLQELAAADQRHARLTRGMMRGTAYLNEVANTRSKVEVRRALEYLLERKEAALGRVAQRSS